MKALSKIAAIVSLIAGGLLPTVSAASSYAINGYCKSFFVVYDPPRIDNAVGMDADKLIGSVSNRVRVNAVYHAGDRLSFAASYNIVPRIQDESLFDMRADVGETGFPVYRFDDFNSRLYPGRDDDVGNVGIFHNLDRFFLTINTSLADIYLGRQAIAWGSGRTVNPTDILAPYEFDELDTEDRVGVDAVRVRIPIGFMGEIDGGYVFGNDFAFKESAFFLRGKVYAARTDISPMIVGFRENLMLGIDLARSIGGAGVWLEGAYVFVDALDSRRHGSGEDYARVTVGIDYALTGAIYGFAEYHYSQAGSGNPDEYNQLFITPAYTDGAVYLLGRHYFIPGASWQMTPLLVLSSTALMNLEDPSVYFAPQVEYNIAENIYLSAGGFIGLGKRPYNRPPIDSFYPSLVYRSEFGGYSDMYFTSFRVYF